MEAKELRIGNVTNKGIVVEIHKDYFYTHDLESSYRSSWFDVDPVLLDEKWLIKFGFEGNKQPFTKYPFDIYIDDFNNCGFYFKGHCLSLFSYVHQLQNLYFAITGEEL